MRIIADHFRQYAHALRFAIDLHGAKKFHPIVKNKHYQISSGARASLQGRKSMFKHGGDNIVEKYTFRLRDVLRGAKRPVFLGGFGGMPSEKKNLNGAIWCVLMYIWIGFVFKNF